MQNPILFVSKKKRFCSLLQFISALTNLTDRIFHLYLKALYNLTLKLGRHTSVGKIYRSYFTRRKAFSCPLTDDLDSSNFSRYHSSAAVICLLRHADPQSHQPPTGPDIRRSLITKYCQFGMDEIVSLFPFISNRYFLKRHQKWD